MARRIRTIKPEINEDSNTAHLSDRAWRLYVSSWTLADDAGNLRGGAAYLHGQIFWGAPGTLDDTTEALKELLRAGLLIPYIVREAPYLAVKGWSKHQRIDHPGQPRVPGPDDQEAVRIQVPEQNSRVSREDLATDLDQGSGSGTGISLPQLALGATVSHQDLLDVYRDYPRHEGKTRGLKKLKPQIRTQGDLDALRRALANYKATRQVREGFVKHFDTFAACWRDYLEEPREPKAQAALPYTGRG